MSHAKATVVIESPMSFTGAARRAWKLTRLGHPLWKILTIPVALAAIIAWWVCVAGWYLLWGLLVVPWRLIRRGQRKEKAAQMRHNELMDQMTHGAHPR